MRQSKRFQRWFKQYGLQLTDISTMARLVRDGNIFRLSLFICDLENRAYRRGLADGQKLDLVDKAMQSVLELGQSLKDTTDKCMHKICKGK